MHINGYPVLYLEFDPDINFMGYIPKNNFTYQYVKPQLNDYGQISMADWHDYANKAYLVSHINDNVVYNPSKLPEPTMDQCKLIRLTLASD